jgi:hypothetical protein
MSMEAAVVASLFTLLHGDRTAYIVALCVVIFVVFAWAAFIREPEEKHTRPHHHHWRHPKSGNTEESRRQRGIFSRLRRRRHRRKERPRNPTLAETGGLPSVRDDEPGPSRPV